MSRIEVTGDGVKYADEVEPRLLLVHDLRDQLGLVGTPIDCDTSNWAGHYEKFNRVAQAWAIGAGAATSNGDVDEAAEDTFPAGDLNAQPDYRQHLARVLTRRALARALGS